MSLCLFIRYNSAVKILPYTMREITYVTRVKYSRRLRKSPYPRRRGMTMLSRCQFIHALLTNLSKFGLTWSIGINYINEHFSHNDSSVCAKALDRGSFWLTCG